MWFMDRVGSAKQRKKIQQYSYGLQDQIGKGFSSVVFKGKNDENGEVVAIKVIDLKSLRDQVGKKMLQSEIQILETLKHQNILRCQNVYSTVNNCYIITEYCTDGDLASLLKHKRRLSENQALRLFKDIFQGFRQMAKKNIIHRDLKPANIFLSGGVAKIADFGFARVAGNPSERQKYNVGTPLYMSPESLKRNVYSIKNDIWSMGVILYQLTHGQTPWESRNEKELLDKMTRLPVNFKYQLHQDTKDFIKKCLQVSEEKRASVKQLEQHPMIMKILNILEDKKVNVEIMGEPVKARPFVQPKAQPKQRRKESKQPVSIKRNSNLITSQINLCRFVFKLLQLAKGLPKLPELQGLLIPLIRNLKLLIQGQQNFMQLEEWQQFMKWERFAKFRLVVQEYWAKYTKSLAEDTAPVSIQALLKQINQFICYNIQIVNRAVGKKNSDQQIDAQYQKQAVSVDYMLTLFQLLTLCEQHKGDYDFFYKYSKIQVIAQGRPITLQMQHWNSIVEKARHLEFVR